MTANFALSSPLPTAAALHTVTASDVSADAQATLADARATALQLDDEAFKRRRWHVRLVTLCVCEWVCGYVGVCCFVLVDVRLKR